MQFIYLSVEGQFGRLTMKVIFSCHCLLLAFFMLMTSSQAADFEAGRQAYIQGDYATALAENYPLAMNGDPRAQYAMGVMNFLGQGTPVNYQQARGWFNAAAEQGDIESMYELGEMFKQGLGGPQDYATALMLFKMAAGRGHDLAKYSMAMMYALGDGVAPEPRTAINLLNEVAQSQDQQLASLAQQALQRIDIPTQPNPQVNSQETTQQANNIESLKAFVKEHPILTTLGALMIYSAMTNNNSGQSTTNQPADHQTPMMNTNDGKPRRRKSEEKKEMTGNIGVLSIMQRAKKQCLILMDAFKSNFNSKKLMWFTTISG
jgi:hypothetical protein